MKSATRKHSNTSTSATRAVNATQARMSYDTIKVLDLMHGLEVGGI